MDKVVRLKVREVSFKEGKDEVTLSIRQGKGEKAVTQIVSKEFFAAIAESVAEEEEAEVRKMKAEIARLRSVIHIDNKQLPRSWAEAKEKLNKLPSLPAPLEEIKTAHEQYYLLYNKWRTKINALAKKEKTEERVEVTEAIVTLSGRYWSPKEIKAELSRDGHSITEKEIDSVINDNLNIVNEKRKGHDSTTLISSLSRTKGRIEELSLLYRERKKDFDGSNALKRHSIMTDLLRTLDQIRCEQGAVNLASSENIDMVEDFKKLIAEWMSDEQAITLWIAILWCRKHGKAVIPFIRAMENTYYKRNPDSGYPSELPILTEGA